MTRRVLCSRISCVIFFISIPYVLCHIPKNNSDIIVSYSGYAEANFEPHITHQSTTSKSTHMKTSEVPTEDVKIFLPEYIMTERVSTTDHPVTEQDVVFIPNEKAPSARYRDEFPTKDSIKIHNFMQKSIGDILSDQKITIEADTEKSKDIFISGKNNENIETTKKETTIETRRSGKETPKLDCRNLDCNNTISSVCGGKYERGSWKYRIFLNECYFRKVNCGFRNVENRYKEVLLEKCKYIGTHIQRPAITYDPAPPVNKPEPVKLNYTRRNSISRRSLTKYVDGQACDHTCPADCPEDYEPECTISSTGNRMVFLNHCKLDYNSCTFGIVWYKRPLSECVGGKKADLIHNRGFIGWMQRVGVVDNKGRLVLS